MDSLKQTKLSYSYNFSTVMLLIMLLHCSPLFWALQALVNANVVNGDTELINEAALYLLSIFRAIKKTEDAVDAHQTPVRILT